MDNAMYSLRIQSKGKITDLTTGFGLGGKPFSIYVRPKTATIETDVVIKCKLICDSGAGDFPVPLKDWTSGSIVAISPDAIDLAQYDIYWGAGEQI